MYSLYQAYDKWKKEKIDKCQAIRPDTFCGIVQLFSHN